MRRGQKQKNAAIHTSGGDAGKGSGRASHYLGDFRVPEAGRDVKGNALHAGHPSAMLAPWASPLKEVAPMWQFLTDVATQVVAGVVVALILRHLMK